MSASRREGKRPGRPRVWASFAVPMLDLVRPGTYDWGELSLAQAFHALQAIRLRAMTYRRTTPGGRVRTAARALSTDVRATGIEALAITSIEDLRLRFAMAILGRSDVGETTRWRREQGIGHEGTLAVEARHHRRYKVPHDVRFGGDDALRAFLADRAGTPMAASLNRKHPDARCLRGAAVVLHGAIDADGTILEPPSFSFVVTYGFASDAGDDRTWSEVLARTGTGETFDETLTRATLAYGFVVDGVADEGVDLRDLRTGRDDVRGRIAAQHAAMRKAVARLRQRVMPKADQPTADCEEDDDG